jgi:glycosyltransferase involved in cell wall biosynthesis
VIRVAQLLHTVAHGGVETALLNWAGAFGPGIDNRWYCFANPDRSEEAFLRSARQRGFHIDTIPWSRWKPVLRCARRVADQVRRHRIDVLHCHNTYANMVGALAARLVPVKTVTTLYVWGDFGFKRNALQWIDQRLLPRFDAVTAHCESCFRDTVARGYPESKLKLLICGYPTDRVELPPAERDARRRGMGVHDHHTVLIYLARFWPEKAHDNLLVAFQRALASNPALTLWLPGAGPELDRVAALAKSMGFDERVRFLGFRDDYAELLALADIQVHPSDNEGVALAICAGMAAGKPIIASNVGGVPEVLRDGVSALLIPPRSPDALARSIVDLAADAGRAAELGREARRFLVEHYSLELAAGRVEAVYRGVLGR